MGLYTDNAGQGPLDLFEVRVSSVRVRDRETLRVAGLAEISLSIPSRGYPENRWVLEWSPDDDELEWEFRPAAESTLPPQDEDGDLNDEIYELGQYLLFRLILGDSVGHPVLTWESEGREVLERAWGLDTADLQIG